MWRGLFRDRDSLSVGDAISLTIGVPAHYEGLVTIRRLEILEDGSVRIDCDNDEVAVSFDVRPGVLSSFDVRPGVLS